MKNILSRQTKIWLVGVVIIGLGILACLDFSAECLNIFEWLRFALDKAVGLRKQLVLNTNTGHPDLAQFTNQAAHIIEIPVTGITIQQDRNACDIGHELQLLHHLGPGKFIVIPYRMLRRKGQAGAPDTLEPSFFHDSSRKAIMRFEDKFRLTGAQ